MMFLTRAKVVMLAAVVVASAGSPVAAGERRMVYIGRPGGAEGAAERMAFYSVDVAYFAQGEDWSGFIEALAGK